MLATMGVRNHAGRRPATTSRVFTVATVGLVGLTGIMFLGVGEAAPLVAQVTLVATVVWLLFRAFDALFPGVALRRPRVASVGEDGIQTERAFLPWGEVKTVTREAESLTLEQMKAQQREDAQARRQGRAPRSVASPKHYVRVLMREGNSHVLTPAKVRTLLDDLQSTLERYRQAHAEPDSPGDFRTPAEARALPLRVVLDAGETREVRIRAFAELTQSEKKQALASLADDEMRRLLSGDRGQ